MTKKHGHEEAHAHCEHCLHFCGHCDVAYCCDCKREWGVHTSWYPWTYNYPGSATITTGTKANNDYTFADASCTHSHA